MKNADLITNTPGTAGGPGGGRIILHTGSGSKAKNNGQATHGARKQEWRTQAAWAKICFLRYISYQ